MNVLILFIFINFSWADNYDDLINSLPRWQQHYETKIAEINPKKQATGIKEYLSIIGLDVDSGKNIGFSSYNSAFINANKCFEHLAADFYASILLQDLAKQSTINKTSYIGKPSINETVANIDLKAGWLWEKALSYSSGDKMLAMQLIGICGHDDSGQISGSMKIGPNFLKNFNMSDKTDSNMRLQFKQWSKNIPKFSTYSHESKEELFNVFKERFNFEKGVLCPYSNSIMYYPQALGAEVDIPQKLKDKITQSQAPKLGGSVIPSKSYHIMGSAYSTCHLVRAGIPDFVINKIVKGAINGYRSSKVCEQINFNLERSKYLSSRSIDDVAKDFKKIHSNLKLCYDITEIAGTKSFQKKHKTDESICYITKLFDDSIITDPDITDEIIFRKTKRIMSEFDVAQMFKWSISYFISLKCTGPQITESVRSFLSKYRNGSESNPCPESLSKDRCDSARRLMDTYLIDFEWSEAQHIAGLDFAKKNCSKYNPAITPEVAACKILGEQKSVKKAELLDQNKQAKPIESVQ